MYVYIYIYIYQYMYTQIYMYIQLCKHIYIYIYVHIHIHIYVTLPCILSMRSVNLFCNLCLVYTHKQLLLVGMISASGVSIVLWIF